MISKMQTPQPNQSPNRLIHETSPYLLQHAGNPVEWYSWGEEALNKAKQEKKPILLSIGYSACHWCHVMERESFENNEIAALMNTHFVNIKVDREERPDLDQIYQSAVQLFIRRGGGWPLTMFLTPDQIPFYGGTYFPPNDRYGMPGFPTILEEVATAYKERPDDVAKTVQNVKNALARISEGALMNRQKVPENILEMAVSGLSPLFDSTHGGFGTAPKFPSSASLSLLLRYAQQTGDATTLNQVTFTLGKMAWGGIYDQIGGGFHRYSTDAHWLTPHFEKMLYDNAQLAPLYFSAYQKTGQTFYLKIAEEILEYVLREMTDPAGGFYTTQDADSEGHEGKFFVWTQQEIETLLGKENSALSCRYYGVTAAGNFEGKNILNLQRSVEAIAREAHLEVSTVEAILDEGKRTLFLHRETRIKPFRDEKILTNLNGLMISAFVAGFQITRKSHFLMAAENAAKFVLKNLYKEGRLLRVYKNDVSKLNGYLDDYVYFIDALLDVYEATSQAEYLEHARRLTTVLIDQFWDEEKGGFFFTARDHETLVARHKTYTDQSVPSGNAVAAAALGRLFYLTENQTYFDIAEKTLEVFCVAMEENSFAVGNMIIAADFYLQKPKEIVVVGKFGSPEMEVLLAHIYRLYIPNKTVRMIDSGNPPSSDWAKDKREILGKPTVYFCQNAACLAPMTEWEEIKKALLERR
jgi:uncharacterized protein YyaL (SSP411 family)